MHWLQTLGMRIRELTERRARPEPRRPEPAARHTGHEIRHAHVAYALCSLGYHAVHQRLPERLRGAITPLDTPPSHESDAERELREDHNARVSRPHQDVVDLARLYGVLRAAAGELSAAEASGGASLDLKAKLDRAYIQVVDLVSPVLRDAMYLTGMREGHPRPLLEAGEVEEIRAHLQALREGRLVEWPQAQDHFDPPPGG